MRFDPWRRVMWQTYRRAMVGELSHTEPHYDAMQANGLFAGANSMFSIGPGDGAFELAWLRRGGERLGYVETYRPHARTLERNAQTLGLSARIAERHVGAFQFIAASKRYHLVVSIHSWFGFGCNEPLLRKALAMREPGGRLVISLSRTDDFLAGQLLQRRGISDKELSQWAADKGMAHQLIQFDHPISPETLVVNGEFTAQAKDLIAFFHGRPWWRIPGTRRKELKEKLIQSCANNVMVRRHACLVFGDPQ